MFIDSHAHLTSPELVNSVETILVEAKNNKVEAIINICTDKESLVHGLELAKKHGWIYNAAATPPHTVEQEGELYFDIMAQAALSGQLVAVGETGLDYYYEHCPRLLQRNFLIRYMELAKQSGLPLVIHCRNAFSDLFEIIEQHYKDSAGVLHCFTGTAEEAQVLVDMGWCISISGIATFKKSSDLRSIIKAIPLESLLIETDAPYLAPQKHRGKLNSPAYIAEIAETIAAVKDIPVETVAAATTANAKKLFALPLGTGKK